MAVKLFKTAVINNCLIICEAIKPEAPVTRTTANKKDNIHKT
jgi:hypothetical protein